MAITRQTMSLKAAVASGVLCLAGLAAADMDAPEMVADGPMMEHAHAPDDMHDAAMMGPDPEQVVQLEAMGYMAMMDVDLVVPSVGSADVATIAECAAACEASAECNMFTWGGDAPDWAPPKPCYLKMIADPCAEMTTEPAAAGTVLIIKMATCGMGMEMPAEAMPVVEEVPSVAIDDADAPMMVPDPMDMGAMGPMGPMPAMGPSMVGDRDFAMGPAEAPESADPDAAASVQGLLLAGAAAVGVSLMFL